VDSKKACHRTNTLITGLRSRRETQQRLIHPPAPPSYGQVSDSSKVHRRVVCFSAHLPNFFSCYDSIAWPQTTVLCADFMYSALLLWFSPAAAESRGRRQWSGHRPRHHDHIRTTKATPPHTSAFHSALAHTLPNHKAHRAPTHTSALFTFRLARNARAYISVRSNGFCAIWVCISSSSSS
jgi:hypothetical protein